MGLGSTSVSLFSKIVLINWLIVSSHYLDLYLMVLKLHLPGMSLNWHKELSSKVITVQDDRLLKLCPIKKHLI